MRTSLNTSTLAWEMRMNVFIDCGIVLLLTSWRKTLDIWGVYGFKWICRSRRKGTVCWRSILSSQEKAAR